MRYYNEFYSYDDIDLWSPDAWKDYGSKGEPLFGKLLQLNAAKETVDHYADRHDEVRDATNREPYFTDVVEYWKEQGLVFNSCGMMNVTMVPVSVVEKRNAAPKVLFIPAARKFGAPDPHWAMNLLEDHKDILLQAAKEEVLVQFVSFAITEMGIETQGTFRITYQPVYLDISALFDAGLTLTDVEGIDASKFRGSILCGTPVVLYTNMWQENKAHQVIISGMYHRNVPNWNHDMQIRSACGRLQAESFHMEHDFRSPFDPKIDAFWEKKGLICDNNIYDNNDRDWYVVVAPKSITTKPDVKIPLVCIMKEPRTAFPEAMETAFQFYYEYLDLAAQGQMIVLYYANETPDENETLVDIIAEAEKKYPIDPQRIYITGQSHNGYYALEFYRRHPDIIAAAATLCDPIGLELGAMMSGVYESDPEKYIASFAAHDMPLINFNGELENRYPSAPAGSEQERKNTRYFKWRLEAFRCPPRTDEEIVAAKTTGDYVSRRNGIPADRTEVQFVMGTELYISDLKNIDGNWHLRFVTQENLPHMITPQMAHISWSYMRRFARDRKTGESIELY